MINTMINGRVGHCITHNKLKSLLLVLLFTLSMNGYCLASSYELSNPVEELVPKDTEEVIIMDENVIYIDGKFYAYVFREKDNECVYLTDTPGLYLSEIPDGNMEDHSSLYWYEWNVIEDRTDFANSPADPHPEIPISVTTADGETFDSLIAAMYHIKGYGERNETMPVVFDFKQKCTGNCPCGGSGASDIG